MSNQDIQKGDRSAEITVPGAKTASDTDEGLISPSPDDLRLERFGNNLEDVDDTMDDDDDDEDEDEPDHIAANHPLFGLLAGRLGQPRRRGSTHKYDSLHPVTSVLTLADVDACVELEKSFPEHERATREKFEYRLSRCPELSFGIFTQPTKVEAEKAGKPSQRRLIAMIVATRTPSPSVTDVSMAFPKDWKTNKSNLPRPGDEEAVGHQDIGRTIALHSLVTAPEHRNKGLAAVLLTSYVQRIRDSKIADRIALLAHDNLERFYGRYGFDSMGPSSCQHGGGGWNNMIIEFTGEEED